MDLAKRIVCYNDYYNGPCYSSWDVWGRWVAAAVILGIAVLAFFSIACINARRRRRRGLRPYAGTSWMAPPPYTPNPQYQQVPPPQYYSGQPQPPPESYYGPRANDDIELQQPPNARHYGGEPVYQPPPGPPPNKPKA